MKTKHLQTVTLTLLISALTCATGHAATLTVTNANDSGPGSLRQAILDANTNANLDIIEFNIPGPDVHTISITNALPNITRPVIIDGYTQPGSSSNTLANGDNAVLLIELNGGGRPLSGLSFTGGGTNCTVRGLVINSFPRSGSSRNAAILFDYSPVVNSGNVVEGCFLGTDPTGTIARENAFGVNIQACSGNRIGGTTPAARNLISGNDFGINISGISLRPGGTNNVVQGNFIGTDVTGTNALVNGIGITIAATNSVIGGTNAAARNIIAQGIECSSSSGHVIQGNFIGTDVTGTKLLRPSTTVIFLSCSSCLVGGTTATPGSPPGNVIAGGLFNNITIQPIVNNPTPTGNVIQGNLIGTDATGTLTLGNPGGGINAGQSLNTLIGGTNAGAGNVISGHNGLGVFLSGGARTNVVQGNRIGTDITGAKPLPNVGNGILIEGQPNLIGPGNIIAFNGGDGINLGPSAATNNRITANSIFANGATFQHLGIDLGANGVTPNDAGDTDNGPNHLQNFPVLTNVVISLTGVMFQGFLSSAPNTSYTVEFFVNDICEPSGVCEGQTFLGSTNVTTDATGTNFFSVTLAAIADLTCRFQASATATDPNGNTSEFSACRPSTSIDTDGDGACDVEEVFAGIDLNNPASVFRMTAITREGDDIRIAWQAGGDRTNMLQTITSFAVNSCSNHFTDLPPEIVFSGAGDVFTNRLHIGGATNRARYYRVRLVR